MKRRDALKTAFVLAVAPMLPNVGEQTTAPVPEAHNHETLRDLVDCGTDCPAIFGMTREPVTHVSILGGRAFTRGSVYEIKRSDAYGIRKR